MKVTPQMTTESGSQLLEMADFIGEDDVAIMVRRSGDRVLIIMDSAAYPNRRGYFSPEDARGIMALLGKSADEVEEIYGKEEE
jgi:hypothetical protein